MTSPRILLKVSNLRPKKSLGQNFLLNQTLAETIVDRAGIKENDHVLEIGCGLGAITIPAAKKAARLVAVEKDAQLLDLLRTELAVQQLSNVELVHQDILTLNFADYFGPETPSAIVIGNLPYNISSQIIVLLIASRAYIRRALLMLQKEMAQRLIASPGNRDYGRLSVMLQYGADVKVVAEAPATAPARVTVPLPAATLIATATVFAFIVLAALASIDTAPEVSTSELLMPARTALVMSAPKYWQISLSSFGLPLK